MLKMPQKTYKKKEATEEQNLLQLGIGKFLICRMQNFNRKAANTEETKSNFSN